MRRARLLPAVLLAWLGGCARLPGPVAPPAEQGRIEDHPPHYVYMRDAEALQRVVAGIARETHIDWRWTQRRAGLRLTVDETQGLHFQVTLAVPEQFLRAGGSRIDVRIGGRLLGSIPANRVGYIAWRQPVPEEWVARGREIVVELLADAEYREGREKRAYALGSAGFTL